MKKELGSSLKRASTAKRPSGREPTEEQKAILETAQRIVAKGGGVLVIEAGAGTGKTTTDRMLADVLPGIGQYTAFNAALTRESAEKFQGTRVACNTTHSLAFRAVGKQFAHRLNQGRVKSSEIAQRLGIEDLTIETSDPTKPKRLAAGWLASQVTGAIRRFCQSADKEITGDHFKYVDGIDLPSPDGRRTSANNERVRDYLLPFAQRAWEDLSNPEGTLPFGHDHYVKVWQLSNPVIAADYILVDECFLAGTLVETDRGPVPIEQIVSQKDRRWRVLASQDGGKTVYYSQVTTAYRTPRTGPIVRIEHEQGEIYCTANHPIWIKGRGWTAAGLVAPGDSMPYLRESNEQTAEMLLSPVRVYLEGTEQVSGSRVAAEEEDLPQDEASTEGDPQSYGEAGDQGQGLSLNEVEGRSIRQRGTGRERTYLPNRVEALSFSGKAKAELALEPRVCCVQWTTKSRVPDELQDRHCLDLEESRCRSRWGKPSEQSGEGQGPKEVYEVGVSRVVRVEVYERGSSPRSNCDGLQDYQCVYTLSVEAGSYFANGVLVKNCQDTAPVMLDVLRQQVDAGGCLILVGDSAQQIYEWRGAVNAMAAFPGAPRLFLSQSFRFGQAIANVANRVLESLREKTPLRLKGLPSIPSRLEALPRPKAILTRTNACAVNKLLEAIADGRRPFLVGGGSDVLAFVAGARDLQEGRPTSHPELACFSSWAEVQEYAGLDDGEDLRLMVKLIDTFGVQTIAEALLAMPKEEDADLVISTAHKSKGREWDEVQLAPDFPTKSKCQDSDLKLLYVAVTRAKIVLDVTECPFFTGRDSLRVDDIISTKPEAVSQGIVPPAPIKATCGYTWARGRDGDWLVRGPCGNTGEEVEVERRDGSKSLRKLGQQVARFNDGIALYKV